MSELLVVAKFKQYQSADIVAKSNGRPPWVKMHREFFLDYDMRGQKPATRLLALFLVSFASEFLNEYETWGTFPHDETEIATRARLPKAAVREGISALLAQDFLHSVASDSRTSRESIAPPSRKIPPLEAEAEEELPKSVNGSTSPLDRAAEKAHAIERLLDVLSDKDPNTHLTISHLCRELPPSSIEKVRESVVQQHPRSPVRYAVGGLKSELQERAA